MLQLHENPIAQINEDDTLERIAIEEIRQRKNPAVIRRYIPDGTHEDCAVQNLLIDDDIFEFQLNKKRFL